MDLGAKAFDEMLSLSFSPYLGNFILKNKEYLKTIIENGEEIIPEKLGLVYSK